jgi:hypothetical protein
LTDAVGVALASRTLNGEESEFIGYSRIQIRRRLMRQRWAILGWVAGICVVVVSVVAYELIQRDAAQRMQSRNNLIQMVLALHNYHEVNFMFPPGTRPNEKLKPEKRLSWQVDLLPYLEGVTIYRLFDLDKAWDDPANRTASTTQFPVFINLGVGEEKQGDYPVTHYVGLAGLGADGPTLPVTSPKAGCFAYDRGTRMTDIKDGLSNTAMVSEASKDYGPWAAGGRATIRPLTEKPYVNGPDGIGGPFRGGFFVGFADMSVHFISQNIDPTVMEAMMTISGGETVDRSPGPVRRVSQRQPHAQDVQSGNSAITGN